MQNDPHHSPAAAHEDMARIVAEQTRLLYATLPTTFLAHTLLVALVAWVNAKSIAPAALATWAMLVACMLAGRMGLLLRYRRARPAALEENLRWRRHFRIGVALGGAVWGLTAVLIFPADTLTLQVFLAVVLIGIGAGAATSLSVDIVSIMLFLVLALVPLLIRFVLEGSEIAIVIGIMIVAFLAFIGSNARRVAQAFKENLTLRIEAETRDAALLAAKEEAERANLAKSKFLSSMSHELRTPMNAVIGFTQLLEMDDSLSAEQKEHLQSIHSAASHLLELINEVLDLSRIEAGRIELSIEAVELPDLVKESLDLIRPLAAQHGIELHLTEPAEEVLCGQADRMRLKQVLINLISNAIKYNRKRGIVRLDIQRTDDNRVRLNVTDTGHGIPIERQPELFIMFNRLDIKGVSSEGTGIGLAVAKRLVEMMGGSIGLDSVPGQGSTFWIELPAATA